MQTQTFFRSFLKTTVLAPWSPELYWPPILCICRYQLYFQNEESWCFNNDLLKVSSLSHFLQSSNSNLKYDAPYFDIGPWADQLMILISILFWNEAGMEKTFSFTSCYLCCAHLSTLYLPILMFLIQLKSKLTRTESCTFVFIWIHAGRVAVPGRSPSWEDVT